MMKYSVNFQGRLTSRRREYRVIKIKRAIVNTSAVILFLALFSALVVISSSVIIMIYPVAALALLSLAVLISCHFGYLDVFLLHVSRYYHPHQERPKKKIKLYR